MTEDSTAVQGGAEEKTKPDDDQEGSAQIQIRFTLDKRIDLALHLVFVLFGLFLIIEASGFRPGLIPDPVTSRGLPYLTGGTCVLVGLILAAIRLMTWSQFPGNKAPGEGHEDEEGYENSWIRVFSIVVVTWLSVVLLKSLGYLIVTPAFMIISCWLMRSRTWGVMIGFPVGYTLVTWYIFSQPLQFALPLGFLAPLFRTWGLAP
jgi:hypothetical protein